MAAAAYTDDDDDVIAERNRVQNGEANDSPLLLNRLSKVYDNFDFRCNKMMKFHDTRVAVNDLSLGLQKSEVIAA